MEGKEARDYFEKLIAQRANEKGDILEAAKKSAAARGKEPFNLSKLEALCDTTSDGRVAPLDERHAQFEYLYYVTQPSIMTIAELAAHIESTNKW